MQSIGELKQFINSAWGLTGERGKSPPPFFPGPQPISIERKHIPSLKRNEYFVCEKTDGTRVALVCLRIGTKKLTYLVNRALEFTPVKMFIKNSAYEGTILDAELISTDNGKSSLMVYDSVMVSGISISGYSFPERLKYIHGFLAGIMKSPRDPFEVKLKTFYPMVECKTLFDKIKGGGFDHGTDGLIFTPVNEPVRVGTHNTMFKWKPRDKNTVDFLAQVRDDGQVGLYVQDRGEMIFESIYNPAEVVTDIPDVQSGDILECQYQHSSWPRWWKPIGRRTDKKHPNNRRTLSRTMVNIEQDIQESEFLKIQK